MINMKKKSIFGVALALTLMGGTMTALAAFNEGQSISIFSTTITDVSANDIDNVEIISEGNSIDANSILRISLNLGESYQYDGYMMGNDENGDFRYTVI